MKKENPFYNYLEKYEKNLVLSKTDSHGSNFLLLPLDAPEKHVTFDYDDEELTFKEHHLTIYQYIDDDIGKSIYHYTARFESHKIHVYFNERGQSISATIQPVDSQEILSLNRLFNDIDEELLPIRAVLEQKVQPMAQELYARHSTLVFDLETRYTQGLSDLKNRMFDASEEIVANKAMAQKNIKLGKQLLPICYKKNFMKQTQNYLEKLLQSLTAKPLNTLESLSDADNPEQFKAPVQLQSNQQKTEKKASAAQLKSSNSKKTTDSDFQTAYEQFSAQFDILASKWNTFEECTDISRKIELFDGIETIYLKDLIYATLILETAHDNNSALFDQRSLFLQAELDTNLYREKREKAGILLLSTCLRSPELLAVHGEKLKQFAPLLANTYLDEAICQPNIDALAFLLKHGTFKINRHLVKRKKGLFAAPLCIAYQSNQIEIFKLLLSKNASCMALYEGMPLAHTLLQLPSNHPFHSAFLSSYGPAIDGNPQFYGALCTAVSRKLEDPHLNEKQKESLNRSYVDYEQKKQTNHGEQVRFSSVMRENIAVIRETLNPDTVQALYDNEILDLQETLSKESAELAKMMREKHQSSSLIRSAENTYRNARQLIDNGFGNMYHGLTKEDMIRSIKESITRVQANITVLKYNKRTNLRKSELEAFNKAVLILETAGKKQQQLELHAKVSELSRSIEMLNKKIEDWELSIQSNMDHDPRQELHQNQDENQTDPAGTYENSWALTLFDVQRTSPLTVNSSSENLSTEDSDSDVEEVYSESAVCREYRL